MQTASERVRLHEADSASANERLYNHRLNISTDGTLFEFIRCHCHQSNLVEGSLVGVTHQRLISRLFSFTHFLQASTHFAKLKHAVKKYIEESVTINIVTDCPVVPSDFLQELCDMQLLVRRSARKASGMKGTDASSSERSGTLNRFEKMLANFKRLFNGDMTSSNISHPGFCFGFFPHLFEGSINCPSSWVTAVIWVSD